MLYKFCNKKGNITVVLIGLISVMLLMTLALSKRMTGHTQLLTLGDYTQISRYFLESYVSHIMQQVRAQVTDPTSDLSQEICKGIDASGTEKDLKNFFKYTPSDELTDLTTIYGNNNKITNTTFEIKLTNKTKPIGYPDGVKEPADKEGVEKKGYIEVTCNCEFNKRKYNLTVQYPFSVVYRMTPIIKDFMLYVDRINCEQNYESGSTFDKLNVTKIEGNKYAPRSRQDCRDYREYSGGDISPMVLMQPLDQNQKYYNTDCSGKVYLGAPFRDSYSNSGGVYDQPVYINLTGGDVDESISETFLISAYDIGVATDSILEPRSFLPIPPGDKDLILPCWPVPLKNYANANMSVMGFSDQAKNVFNGVTWSLQDFLCPDGGNEDHLKNIKVGTNDLRDAMEYATALKLFGINVYDANNGPVLVPREIYGNVFARFIELTFWWPNGCAGVPLNYDMGKKISDVPEQTLGVWDINNKEVKRRFEPLDDGTLYDDKVDYKFFMSKVVSGSPWEKDKDQPWASNYFMAMNMKLDLQNTSDSMHALFCEDDFEAADGFRIDKSVLKFNQLGEKWFGVSDKDEKKENLSPIEKRIGRAFKDGDKFLKTVGYPEKFLVNGVVYVGGEDGLTLDQDLVLDDENCSGGIILVDGPISIKNIYRGDNKLKANNFKLENNSADDMFKKWNNEAPSNAEKKYSVAPDKIITFVSLKGKPITLNGNIVLGVQLVNFGDPNAKPGNYSDLEEQIKWSDEVTEGIIFYGSLACNRLNLIKKIQSFGKTKKYDNVLNAPFFLYPPVMATSTPPLAVQVMEDMRSYQLTSGVAPE